MPDAASTYGVLSISLGHHQQLKNKANNYDRVTSYTTSMRVLDEWWFGPIGLMTCEVNPRSGPPDVCIGAETGSVERWISPPPWDVSDWEVPPHEETWFALFLLSRMELILFEAGYHSLEPLEEKVAQVRAVLAPLADPDTPKDAAPQAKQESSEGQVSLDENPDGQPGDGENEQAGEDSALT